MYENKSDASIINQLDGNVSLSSNVISVGDDTKPTKYKQIPILKKKQDKISIAHNLPTVAS